MRDFLRRLVLGDDDRYWDDLLAAEDRGYQRGRERGIRDGWQTALERLEMTFVDPNEEPPSGAAVVIRAGEAASDLVLPGTIEIQGSDVTVIGNHARGIRMTGPHKRVTIMNNVFFSPYSELVDDLVRDKLVRVDGDQHG